MQDKLILWFKEIGQHDILTVGGKGANLGEMAGSLKVPAGFCLTSKAYIDNLKQQNTHEKINQIIKQIDINNLATIDQASQEIYNLITTLPLLPEIKAAVTKAFTALAAGNPSLPVAVRSSATAEDLVDASFAGQQETYLNISGIDNILLAIQKCWASLWTSRAIHYRTKKQFDHTQVYMAVIIQEMLPAEISGVMFTANPVSNSRQELLIEAARGLGEALVSGAVTGDNYIITKEGIKIKSKTISEEQYGQLLPDEVIRELALHGVKIENYYENYMDIEWAYYKGKLYFLQARAITTLADEEPAEFDWHKLTAMQKELLNHVYERYPDPIYPIDSVIVKLTYAAYFEAMENYGYYVPLMNWNRVEKGDFPEFFEPPRIRPGFPMMALFSFKLWQALRSNPAREWYDERKYLLNILEKLAQRDVNSLPYDIVYSYISEALSQFEFFIVLRYKYFVNNRLPSSVLLFLLKRLFGAEAKDIKNDLLAGIPCITTEINQQIRDLAYQTKEMTEVAEFLKAGQFDNFRQQISNLPLGDKFLNSLDTFLHKYGERETSMGLGGIASVTWQDAPEVVLGMIRGTILEDPKLEENRAKKLQQRIKNAEERLNQKLSSGLYRLIPRSFIKKLIQHSKNFDIFRENSHYDVTMSMKVFKVLFLVLGQRLVRNNITKEPRDIFYLTFYEIKEIILIVFQKHKELDVKSIQAKIEKRKVDLTKRIVRWRTRNLDATRTNENSMRGIPASSGTISGTARIITGAQDFYKLQPGDIMVAPYTNPAWTPLFTTAAGLVVDTGGAASHASIIAREYGLPAVMGTGNATTWIKDGEEISINGSNGLIIKEKAI